MPPLAEKNIVIRLHADDDTVMELLYDNYADTLYGVCMRILGDDSQAKDAMQETFIKVWKKRHSYDASKGRIFTWMLNISRRSAIDIQRSESRQSEKKIHIAEQDVYASVDKGLNVNVLDIRGNVNKLDEKYRIVIDHLFFKGMTQKEASEALELPLGTVKTRLRIAMRELRGLYGAQVPVMMYLLIISSL
jgi:RNA polymerase sigma-70 factor (ECF subfamily)